MTTVAYDGPTGFTALAEVDVFIPELWSDEIIASYKSNLVMPQLVITMNHVGKKGDTVHIPTPTRDVASAKAATTAVSIIANTEQKKDFTITEHWEYSKLIEDIANIQAIDTFRAFYTNDAGYALAKKVDTDLHALGETFAAPDTSPTVAGSDYSKAVIGGDGSTVWDGANASELADLGIRTGIQHLDDSDVPSVRRALVIPPVTKKDLLGEQRFTEHQFVGEAGSGNTIRNGLIGDVYSVPVYVSTNCAVLEDDDDERAVLLFQKEAAVLFEQMRPRTQTQYKQEYLATLFTADIIYDTGTLRPEGGVTFIVPGS